jgi:hypothetical protein
LARDAPVLGADSVGRAGATKSSEGAVGVLGRHSKHTSKGSRSVDESGEGEHGVEWEGVEELAEEAGLKRQRLQPRVFIRDKTSIPSARMLRHSDRVRLSAAIFNESIGHGVQRGEIRTSSG